MIRRYLQTENLHFVAVGPEMEKFAAALKRGDATPITYETEVPPEVLVDDAAVAAMPLRMGAVAVWPFERALES